MSAPAPAFLLVCPQCGKKYAGDPNKPNARYKCPADGAELTRVTTAADSQKTIQSPAETQKIDMSLYGGQDDAATRVINVDDDKTRVVSAQDATLQGNGSATITMMKTVAEERRSVLALLEGGGADSPAAALLGKKYEEVGKLGQGGVGEVVKVLDRDLKREVAMKRLLPESMQSEDALIRFVEEAQATGQLEHPNIVPVHDLGVDADGRVYFTLKYVQGASLKQVLKGRKENAKLDDGTPFRERYSAMRMVEILISMCQAIAYAHSKGIIHRDLKPDNVMLGKFGEVLVMDWGLAKVLGEEVRKRDSSTDTVRVMTSRSDDDSTKTMEGSIAGTPAYMAPEQAAGKISELDQRTDVYALGAILYEILGGTPPYHGAPALQLVKQVVEAPPPPLKNGTAGFQPIPRELKAICEKAMARQPEERYRSASELRDDLQAFLENQPVKAAPDTALQRAAKWVRRNRRQVQTSAASAAAVVALVVGGWFAWRVWTVRSLVNEAHTRLERARTDYKISVAAFKPDDSDPYAAQSRTSILGEKNRVFRASINGAIEPLRKAIDIAPNNRRARLLMAEAYMELWRLALGEENPELAKITRAEVERFSPDPALFSDELNGFGSLRVSFDPPTSEAYLFVYETLRARDGEGKDLPARLIPVPYDAKARRAERAFLEAEQKRVQAGAVLASMDQRHSVYNLDATPASRLGGGTVTVDKLPPGSYLLLARAPGHIEARIPIRIARQAKVERSISLPGESEAPPFFFYMAGGDVIAGGSTAGAPAPHVRPVKPSYIYHDEITMAEYSEFLQSLVRSGRPAEARQRLPKDFGRNLATLNSRGELVPIGGGDPQLFAQSPVRGVSYNDALAYIAWRSQRDGYVYRLPKDWEWEAACRGADGRKYSWGDQPGKGLAVVTQGYGDTGSKMSWKWTDYKDESPWGLHNMAGGAAEWTDSFYDPKAKPEDPVFGQRTIRGNAWALPPVGLECAFRTSGQPDYFHPTIGFRLALDYPVKRIGSGTQQAAHAH